MKNLFFTLALLSSAELVLAQVPRITDKKFANYQNFTVNEKAEVGTFFLLQSLAAKGLIGGDSGVCVNYKRGDGAGTQDQITFAVKTQAPESGAVTMDQASKAEVDKLKPVINQMNKFFAKNCVGQGKDCVTVDVTGFSDGTRSAGATNPSVSMTNNTKLAQNRANLYADEIAPGVKDFGTVKSHGSPSQFGNYLDIINKVHGGNYNAFLKSLKPGSAEEKFATLHKDHFLNILQGKENYKIDCPVRRVTTLDFKFNPSSAQFAENSSTTVSPSLYAGGADFNFNALMDVGMQVGDVTNGESLLNSPDADVDNAIEKMMKKSGINDPDLLAQCKGNPGTRQMVRFLSNQFNRLGNKRTKLLAESRKDRTSLLVGMREDDANPGIKAMYESMAKELDKGADKGDFPGATDDGGLSNTKLNCFGVQSSLQAYAKANGDKIQKACIPLKGEADTNVKFNAKTTHIGCTKCGTGLKVAEVPYMDPVTGKQMKIMEPTYVPREQNASYGDHINSMTSNKFVLSNKLDAEIVSLNKIKLMDKVPNDIAIDDQKFLGTFNSEIGAIAKNGSFSVLKGYTNLLSGGKYPALLKKYYGLEANDILAVRNYMNRVSSDNSAKPENIAAQQYIRAGLENKDMTAAKAAYTKAAQPHANDPMETARHTDDPASQLTLAGLKSPSYYELDNCDCSDPGLVDKVIAGGKRHSIMDQTHMKAKAGSCIVSLPIPTSCMVSPNNPGGDVHSDTHTDSKISWIDSEGDTVNVLLNNLGTEVGKTNQNFDFQGCTEKSPFSLAQQVVNSVKCDPSQGFVVPTDEFKDCSEAK